MSETAHKFHRPSWVNEFKAFITRGNVVDLAVGIIIGAAFTAIVSSMVKDIITPVIGLITGGIDFSNIFWTLKGPVEPTLAEAKKAGAVTVNVGVFLNAVIQFLIVSFVIFWAVRVLGKMRRKQEEQKVAEPPPPPAPSKSEVLLGEIRDLLAKDKSGSPV